MVSLKKKSKGFTLIELLVVMVIIAILATLVIVVVAGATKKAHDNQRQSDLVADETALQSYYAQNNNVYPTLANLQSASWVSTNLKGLDPGALVDPKGGAIAATATTSAYGYSVTPAGCDNTAGNECTNFTISAILESDGSTFTKKSNN